MILMFECSWVVFIYLFTVTAVDSGLKALEFLGLQREGHVTKDLPSVALNHYHQVSHITFYFNYGNLIFLLFVKIESLDMGY